jgi:hypothetical protein
MRKPDINIVTETFIKLIEPCLPSVFRGTSRGRMMDHGEWLQNVITELYLKFKENK